MGTCLNQPQRPKPNPPIKSSGGPSDIVVHADAVDEHHGHDANSLTAMRHFKRRVDLQDLRCLHRFREGTEGFLNRTTNTLSSSLNKSR